MADAAETSTPPSHLPWTRHVLEKPRNSLPGFFISPAAYPRLAEATGAQRVDELRDEAVVVLLGEPGTGRTTVLHELAARYATTVVSGERVRNARKLAVQATPTVTPDASDDPRSVFIDDVDRTTDGLVPTLHAVVAQLAPEGHRPDRIWLSARPDAWSDDATEALKPLVPEGHEPKVVQLAALTFDDVHQAIEAYDLDPEAVLARIHKGHAVALARQPGTLLPLLEQVKRDGRLPTGRGQLHDAMCRAACGGDPAVLMAAARLAAFMVFGGHETVGPNAPLTLAQLAGPLEEPPGHEAARTLRPSELGNALRDTGLLTERRPGEWAWQIAATGTYLAAWYVSEHRTDALGIRALFGHPSGRGSDHLEDCAAFAMDLLDGDARATLIKLYPEAELASDLHLRPAHDRLAAARRLLSRCERGGGDTRDEVYKLAAPGLSDIVRPHIEDASRDPIARRQAIRIAREAEARELIEPLVSMALDAHDDYDLRDDAAYAVLHLGTDEQVERLRPLLNRAPEEDPRDQLLGITLRALWRRDRLRAQEFFPYLRPAQQSRYGGSYSSLLHELERTAADWLDGESFDAAVSWWLAACQDERCRTRSREERPIGWDWDRSRLWSAILDAAVLRMDEPLFADGLARWFETINARHNLEPLRSAIDARPELAGACLSMLARIGLPPRDFHFWTDAPLVSVSTVIDLVTADPRPEHFDWLLELLRQMNRSENDESRLISLYLGDRETFACFADLHHCDWPGSEAEARRQRYEEWAQMRAEQDARLAEMKRKRAEEEAAREPPIIDDADHWLDIALEKMEAGEVEWFATLVRRLSFESGEPLKTGWDTYEDLHESPRWLAADEERRARILDALEGYLAVGGDGDTDWWTTNSIPWSEIAAMSALNLLARVRPTAIERMPETAWIRWTPTILRGSGEGSHEGVLAVARREATAAAARWMLTRVRATDTTALGFQIDARRWAEVWPEALRVAVEEALQDEGLESKKRGTAARWLVELSPEDGLELTLDVLAQTREHETWAYVAGGALGARPGVVWPSIVDRFRDLAPSVGRTLLAFATDDANREESLARALAPHQAGQLLGWLDEHYPESQNPMSHTGFSPWPFRREVVNGLKAHASPEAVEVLRASGRRFVAEEAEALWRRATWKPASTDALRRILSPS